MPIVSTDLEFRESVSNLGGAIQATSVSGELNSFFDYVNGAEAAAGDSEYRCLYVRNNHPTLTLYGAKLWISANTPAADTRVQVGLGASPINGVEQSIVNENTAPSGVQFFDAANESAALVIGNLSAGASKSIWIKRIVSPGAAAYSGDGMTISLKGETGA